MELLPLLVSSLYPTINYNQPLKALPQKKVDLDIELTCTVIIVTPSNDEILPLKLVAIIFLESNPLLSFLTWKR